MSPSFARPRGAGRHRLSFITCLTAPGGVAALADLFAWSEWVPVIAWVIALVVVSQLVLTQDVWSEASLTVKAVAMAAFVASLCWLIAMMFGPRLTVLTLRGDPVVATVVDHDVTHHSSRSGGYDVHCYRLRRTDGTPIFGDICRHGDNEFTVGETISVLVDPSGLIAPETPDEVAGTRVWQILGLVSLVATLALAWVTGGLTPHVGSGHRVPRRPHRRRPGRHSL